MDVYCADSFLFGGFTGCSQEKADSSGLEVQTGGGKPVPLHFKFPHFVGDTSSYHRQSA